MAVIAGEEYWTVLYKAVADFGDLMAKAALAKKALEDLGKTSGEVTAAQVAGEQKLVAERQKEIDALKSEAGAADVTAEAYKRYNVQALYGGRSEMGAHLTDLRQELQYETLLNRQRWLLFTSPQQAYAWRQNEYNQRLLMNRAEFAGYFSADQYLAYLQKQIAQWQTFNAALRDRAALYKDNADAALSYYNALTGSHKTLGQLGENFDLSGLAQFTAAVNAVPDANTTVLSVDDTQGLAAITKFDVALNAVPDQKTTVLNVVQGAASRPSDQAMSEVVNAVLNAPGEVSTRYVVDDSQAKGELVRLVEELHQIPPRVDITVGFDDARAKAEMAAFTAFASAHRTFGVTEDVHVVAAGGAGKGGGGGSPPVAAAAPGGENPNNLNALAAAIDRVAAAEKADAAAADAAALAADQDASADKRLAAAKVQAALAAGQYAEAAKAAYAYQTLYAESTKATADTLGPLDDEQRRAALGAIMLAGAEQKAADATVALDAAGGGRGGYRPWWLHSGPTIPLFGGAIGGLSLLGVAIHAAIDLLIGLVAAVGTLVIGLTAFGVAAAESAQKVVTQFKAIGVTANATGQDIQITSKLATGGLDAMTNAVRPQVFELLGAALNAASGKAGIFQQAATKTGGILNTMAAHLDLLVNKSGSAFQHFMEVGGYDLRQFGSILQSVGSVFGKFLIASEATQVSEKFITALAFAFRILADVVKGVPNWLLAAGIAFFAFYHYVGLAVTGVQQLVLRFAELAGKIPGLDGPMTAFAGHIGASNEQLAKFGRNTPQLAAMASAIQQGDKNAASLAEHTLNANASLVKMVAQDPKIQQVAKSIGKSAEEVATMAVGLNKSGISMEEFATRIGGVSGNEIPKLTKGLSDAEKAAVLLAGGISGPTGAAKAAEDIGKAAGDAGAKTGLLSKVMSGLGSFISGNWLLVAAAAAAGFFAIGAKALSASQNVSDFVNGMNDALSKMTAGQAFVAIPVFLGKITQQMAQARASWEKPPDLKATLTSWSGFFDSWKHHFDQAFGFFTGKGTGNGADPSQQKLTAEQQKLLTYFNNLAGAMNHAEKAGFSFSQSLGILTAAGVTQNDTLAVMNQKIDNLITGYQAMGQHAGTIGSDMNALTVAASNQLKTMGQLNTAWDQFTKLVSAPTDSILTLAAGMNTFATDAKAAGASMSGLTPPSVKLQQDFQANYNNVQQLFDAFRNAQAANGGAGNFTKFVKDAVAALIPLAGNNKAAAAEISALAQEAGGPATTNLQALAKWAGNVANPMQQLYQQSQNATVATSNLSHDAQILGNTLQQDLTPLMAQSILQAAKAGPAMQGFAAAVFKSGGNISGMIGPGNQLYQTLLKVSGNASNAQALFIGMAESMGLSKTKAKELLDKILGINQNPVKPKVELKDAEAKLHQLKGGLAESVAPPKANPGGWKGLWSDIYNGFFNDFKKPIDNFFAKQLPAAAVAAAKGVAAGWSNAYTGFQNDVAHPIEGFFTKTIPGWAGTIGHSFSVGWSNAYTGFQNDVAHPLEGFFTKTIPGWAGTIGRGFSTGWSNAYTGFQNDLAHPLESFFTSTFPRFFTSTIPGAARAAWGAVYGFFKNDVADPVGGWFSGPFARFFTSDIPGWAKGAWGQVSGFFKNDVAAPVAGWFSGPFARFFTSDIPGWAKGAWDNTWGWFKSVVLNNLDTFWTRTFPAWVSDIGRRLLGLWMDAWHWFDSNVVQPFDNFWTRTLPSWLHSLGNDLLGLWRSTWGWFDRNVVQPFMNFWTRTLPSWLHSLGNDLLGLWRSTWGWFSRDVLQPFDTFWTRTFPNWLSGIGRDFQHLWSSVASWFTTHVADPIGNWFTHTLPSALENAFKGAVNWVINNVVNKAIGFINDVVGVVHVHINPVHTLAAGGGFDGSVPGAGSHDNYNAVLMGGEYVLRQPARMAAERDFGRGFMDWLNQYDTHSGSGSRGILASQRHAEGGLVAPGGSTAYASGGVSLAGYVNPLRGVSGLRPERIDQGVDFAGSGPIGAIGSGVIIETNGGGWPGGPFMSYRLTSGSLVGSTVYVAENIRPVVRAGQGVKAGQHIADMFNGGTGIEMGFADPSGTSTLSQTPQAGGISGANLPPNGATQVGEIFDELLVGLGVPRAPNFGMPSGGKIPGNIPGKTGSPLSAIANFLKSVGGGILGQLDLSGLLHGAVHALLSLIPGIDSLISSGALDKIFSGVIGHLINPLLGKLLPPSGSVVGGLFRAIMDMVESGVMGVITGDMAAAQAAGGAAGIPGGISAGSGLNNLIQLARYLMAHGATRAAAAGIAGDVYGESAGNPESVGSGGFGLIGWTGNTIGLPPGYHGPTGNASKDLAIQIAGTLGYINANGGLGPINAAGGASNYVAAGQVFSARYERPAVRYSDTRPGVAAQVFSALGGGNPVQLGNTLAKLGQAHHAAGGAIPFGSGYATGGPIDGLIWDDYSVPVPRPWTTASTPPPLGKDMPAPLVPYHSTSVVGWNDAVDAAWAAQDKLDRDYNNLMVSAKHPTGPAFLGMVHDQYEEIKNWNVIAENSLPGKLPRLSLGPPASNELAVSQLYAAAKYPALAADALAVRRGVQEMSRVWGGTWGRGSQTGTGGGTTPPTIPPLPPAYLPGPAGSITLGGLPSFNLQPYATAGGPGQGFSPAGAGSLGFGSGGGVLMRAAGGEVEAFNMPTLAQVAGQFGILVPGQNGFVPVPVAALAGQSMAQAARAAAPPRSLSEAGAASSRIGVNISGDMVINNPRPEKPSDSITRSNQRLAVLAGRGA